jgi:membrane protein implicated in regulation of membrane protease activity
VNGVGLSGATRRVAEHARSFVRLELQLAEAELKKKLSALAAGLGVSTGAAVLAFYALGFGLAAAAAGLATTLSVWLSLLIVAAGVLLLALILGLVGYMLMREGAKPVPEQAIEEAQLTTEALRNGHGV